MLELLSCAAAVTSEERRIRKGLFFVAKPITSAEHGQIWLNRSEVETDRKKGGTHTSDGEYLVVHQLVEAH
jgi:hypothetical protein